MRYIHCWEQVCVSVPRYWARISGGVSDVRYIVRIVCSVGALPFVNAIYGYFNNRYLPPLIVWAKKNKKIVAGNIIVSTSIAFIYAKLTYMFYGLLNGIFSMDSIVYITTNTYSFFDAPENDIRQPLFGVVAGLVYGPFNAIQWFDEKIYAVFLGMANSVLIIGGLVLLASGFKKEERKKFLFLGCCMFPTMLFILCIEQYAVVYFALMLLLYEITQKGGEYAEPYAGAAGALITSAAALPLCSKKKFLDVKSMCKCLMTFAGMILIYGRTMIVLDFAHLCVLEKSYTYYGRYTEKLLQYANFLHTVFLAPSAHMVINNQGIYEYQLDKIDTISITGLILLAVCIFSVVVNREDKLVKMGAAWSLYSFFILGILGYGTKDNILPLYSLYFGWGYWVMIFSGFRSIKNSKVQSVLFYSTTTCAGIFNLYNIIQIIRMGITYYPV